MMTKWVTTACGSGSKTVTILQPLRLAVLKTMGIVVVAAFAARNPTTGIACCCARRERPNRRAPD